MSLKKAYEEELSYLSKMLERCKKELSNDGFVKYHCNGTSRIGEVSPRLEAYQKMLNMYLKALKEYTELCKTLEEAK